MPEPRDVELRCRCGAVHGVLRGASPRAVNRAVCYCDDCQAWAHHLGRADLLDAHGGTEIVQVAPAALAIDRGEAHIRAVRLTATGMHRWFAACCDTPLGNTRTPSLPFVGVPIGTLAGAPDAARRDAAFGPCRGSAQEKFAIDGRAPGVPGLRVGMIAHVARLLLGWKLGGRAWPHPFFDRATGAPRYPVRVLTPAERDALRPRCGPTPAAS